jgi:hypothetical protein
VNDADNRARAVRAAAEILVLSTDRVGGSKLHEDYAAGKLVTLTAAERDAIRRAVRDNAIAFSLLDLAVMRSGSDWGLHYERGIETEIPPLRAIIQLAKLNVAAGRLALEDGRLDEALVSVGRGAALAESLEGEPILIIQLVRLAIHRLNAGLVRQIIAGAELRAEQLDVLSKSLSGTNPRQALQRAMVVETGAMESVVKGTASVTSTFQNGASVPSLLALGTVRVMARPYLLNEERLWLTLMTARIDELDTERHARVPSPLRPTIHAWNLLVRIIGYEDAGMVERADLAEARDALMRAAIAIERRRSTTGRPPAALGELVPAELQAPPIDPLTGRAFRYQSERRHVAPLERSRRLRDGKPPYVRSRSRLVAEVAR